MEKYAVHSIAPYTLISSIQLALLNTRLKEKRKTIKANSILCSPCLLPLFLSLAITRAAAAAAAASAVALGIRALGCAAAEILKHPTLHRILQPLEEFLLRHRLFHVGRWHPAPLSGASSFRLGVLGDHASVDVEARLVSVDGAPHSLPRSGTSRGRGVNHHGFEQITIVSNSMNMRREFT